MEFTGTNCKEEHLGKFDDFTLASPWERFISEIEATVRLWISDGPTILMEKGAVCSGFLRNFYVIKSSWKYDKKNYFMEYHFEAGNDGKYADWTYKLHDLQLYFGVKDFLVIAPQSASGVILDTPEATKILSAVAVALSNCSSFLPAFVPVHDPSRNAFIGVQNLGMLSTRRFEADRIGSQVPIKLMHLEGLYELFVSKFGIYGVDLASQSFSVGFTMKSTYQTLPHDDDDYIEDINNVDESIGSGNSDQHVSHKKSHWDDDCPWSEWYSAEDPIKGFKLVALWREWTVESSLEMAEFENVSPREAHKWIIAPNFSENINSVFDGSRVGFASQLSRLVAALKISYEAKFMEDFMSVENSGSENISTGVVPPASVVDRVLKELFDEEVKRPNLRKVDGSSHIIKGAPLDSLFSQFCLQAIWFGSCDIRAIAMLWIEFVREVRWCWDQCIPLPKMTACGLIDLSTCLVHQKLQMLSECIKQKGMQSKDQQGNSSGESIHVERNTEITDSAKNYESLDGNLKIRVSASGAVSIPEVSFSKSDNSKYLKHMGRGSACVAGSMMLLKSYQQMHVPLTKDPPLMTEDMHEERLQAIELFEDSADFTAQLEKHVLSSDMSAFKAANPEAVFEDFIRWHSPGDWETDCVESRETKVNIVNKLNDWPPRGRLSHRMSEKGNLWREIWNFSPSVQASEQKSLLDADREGEKILHYLEMLRPNQLLEQMVCTAFRASADTLSSTEFGGMKKMIDEMGRLYLTSASCLKPLQLRGTGVRSDIIEGLRRLCADYERVERLLMISASLHQNLVRVPRLSELLSNDYCDMCNSGTRSGSWADLQMEEVKAEVRKRERKNVEKIFVAPTKSQLWRKSLSMGNPLNGHEPSVREMVFFTKSPAQETHRMFIRGTSNDLLVALSITSSD